MKTKWIPIVFLFMGINSAKTETPDMTYSLDQVNAYHARFNLANWDDGGSLMRYVFLRMTEFWNHTLVARSGPVEIMPLSLREDASSFITTTSDGKISLQEYVENSTVNGAIVVHQGKIVFEAYPRMLKEDKHLYMSVAKAFTGTLIALLEERGLIDVNKPIEAYLPALKSSGWAGVPIIDILDMASGINCLEGEEGAYSNPETCYYQFEASLGWVRPTVNTSSSTYEYMSTLESQRPSGKSFQYTSPNTFVLGWLAESVTGESYASLLSTEIWQKIGAEADAVISSPKRGVPIAHAGISSNLRDMARFGLMFTPSGRQGNEPLISGAYLKKIQHGGRPEIFKSGQEGLYQTQVDGDNPRHNTYQWDFVMNDGDFFKSGFGGQGLYISPSKDLVVAFFGTFKESGKGHEMVQVARQLAKSELFN